MDVKDLTKIMKEDLQIASQQGFTQLSLETIEAWVNNLEKMAEDSPTTQPSEDQRISQRLEWERQLAIYRVNAENTLAQYNAQNQSNLAYYNAKTQHELEGFRSVIQLGLMALKSSILINGGAVIALLAFIGHIWDSKLFQTVQFAITDSIFSFFVGVFVATVATAIGYITQVFFVDFGKKTLAEIFRVITILLVLSSYYFFFQGGSQAVEAFQTPLKNEAQIEPIKGSDKITPKENKKN